MNTPRSDSAKKVQSALQHSGVQSTVMELPSSTRTAKEAALSLSCEVAQIAKSIIFKVRVNSSALDSATSDSEKAVLVITSGINRVSEKKVSSILGLSISKADADFVRKSTGFAIGGIPPIENSEYFATLIDEDLFDLDTLWAAAGTPNSVFRLTPQELKKISNGKVCQVKE